VKLPDARRVEPGDPEWPHGFDDLEDPPEGVNLVGTLDDAPKVGIVGTRRADASANRFAHELARELAGEGVAIVSGGASGIDAAAHRGAMDLGRTIAVLATDFARPYPRTHGPLFERIATRGALIHEDHPAKSKKRFIFRNRLIAALSDLVVVVQAPIKSGALSTAQYAFALGRPVFAVPVAPWDRRGAGNLLLVEKGAQLCTSARCILDALGLATPKPKRRRKKAVHEDTTEVRGVLSSEPRTLDALAEATGRSPAELHVELLHLILSGEAVETPEGWVAV